MPLASEEFKITEARRSESRLRLAVTAESGGGKTWSSLVLAFGLVEEYLARGLLTGGLQGKVGVIDTERKSAGLYSHLGPFVTLQLGPPYTTERYGAAFRAMELAGVFVIIVDGISPAWAGVGGLRSVLATFQQKDQFSAYDTTINPAQDEFIDMILRSPCHVICTMRMKTEWVLEERANRAGHMVKSPRRIGLKPIQRDGVEYDFTTVFSIDNQSNRATLVKNRCTLFDGWQPQRLSGEHGRQLATWLLEAEPEVEPVVGGTPSERAVAVGAHAVRSCEQAKTLPDLASVFAAGDKAIKAFRGVLSDEFLHPLVVANIAAKDARKLALGSSTGPAVAPAGGDELDPAIAVALEGLLQSAGIDLSRALEFFEVPALRRLKRERLQVFIAWVNTNAQAPDPIPMPPALAALGLVWPKPKFDDFEDDIPF